MISVIALSIFCFLRQTSAEELLDSYQQSIKDVNDLLVTWGDLGAKKLPGGIIYRALPNNLVSIADGYDYWYITKRNNKMVSPIHAYAIYVGVKALDKIIGPALKKLKVSCVQLNPAIADIHEYTHGRLKNIRSSKGQICGLSSLKNKQKMVVINDHKHFITVAVSYTSRKVQVKFKAMTVNDEKKAVLTNVPMNLSAGLTSVDAFASFSLPPIPHGKKLRKYEPRFVKLELRATGFEGVDMNVDGMSGKEIEALAGTKLEDFIMEKVRNKVNSVLEKMAAPISREIRSRKRLRPFKRSKRRSLTNREKKNLKKQEKKLWQRCLFFGCVTWG
ncbi:hypothetical protein GE061_003673 [Apolygus lucorum]|uniref:Uncharacterized protein n=1 Tax=Apolygus lucorum TaxID=248454 RepID=A0A6A4JCP7_APOLU|nr:hypothetical protein GE061_003673 [Apolygus lucorum]